MDLESKQQSTNKTAAEPSYNVSLRNSLQKQNSQVRNNNAGHTQGGKSSRLSGPMANSLAQNDSFDKPVRTTRNTEIKNLNDN